MLRRLRDSWNKYLSSIPKSEVVDSIPEEQWDRPDLVPRVSKAKRSAFTELLELAFARMPPQDAKELAVKRAALFERVDEADAALERALTEFESVEDRTSTSAAIACDWKADDELEWQAALLADAHSLQEQWSSPRSGLEGDLVALASWLRTRDIVLLDFSSGDNLVAFAVKPDQVEVAKSLFKKLRVPVRARSEA